jgi:hypothetical protein
VGIRLRDKRKFPILTLTILSVTGIFTALQFVSPPLLALLQREPCCLDRKVGSGSHLVKPPSLTQPGVSCC